MISESPVRMSHTSIPNTTAPPVEPVKAQGSSFGAVQGDNVGEEGDGFLDMVFGRGEMAGQSFERKPKTTNQRSIDKIDEGDDGLLDKVSRRGETSDQSYEPEVQAHAAQDEEIDQNLDLSPKRKSKNLDSIFGNTPGGQNAGQPMKATDDDDDDDGLPANIFGRGEMSDQAAVMKPRNSNIPKVKLELDEDDDDDLDGIDPKPKRRSKNIDAMLGDSTKRGTVIESGLSSEDKEVFSQPVPNEDGIYPNGYSFPPKKTWGQAILIGLKTFLKFTFTPLGFLIVLYGLNVVAWGGMLFLLLCNAAPAMCILGDGRVDCDHIDSPRRIWVEIDSQILNSLFCVTGFGLIPWRFRDFYYLLRFRIRKDQAALRKLAGYHRSWFRLPGSDRLPVKPASDDVPATVPAGVDEDDPTLPRPSKRAPDFPLTGARAPPTVLWKMDYVVWAFVLNTFLQAVLSGFMWGLNRYDRPSWSTGLFVGLACVVAGLGGLMQFLEGKRIKKVEGVPRDEAEVLKDSEKGVADGKGVEKGNQAEQQSALGKMPGRLRKLQAVG